MEMRKILLPMMILLLAAPIGAGELAGVNMDEKASVGDEELMLNGMGLRKKAIFKVYVGGFYLPEKRSDASAILGADTSRVMVMEFMRNVSAEQLCGGWNDGLAANYTSPSAELTGQFEELCAAMEDVSKGDRVTFTYEAGGGTSIDVKGADKGTIEGKEFSDALFGCWIGDEPSAGGDFKAGVLGG
jgi:hypothetical protein